MLTGRRPPISVSPARIQASGPRNGREGEGHARFPVRAVDELLENELHLHADREGLGVGGGEARLDAHAFGQLDIADAVGLEVRRVAEEGRRRSEALDRPGPQLPAARELDLLGRVTGARRAARLLREADLPAARAATADELRSVRGTGEEPLGDGDLSLGLAQSGAPSEFVG